MKKFAIFLPQFHDFKENDAWWGKGYTEWVPVKRAKPLFAGHRQPKVPLDDNYYCLMDNNTVKWQTELSHEYGIDGFIYYHYYFNGKLLMEKPAENLLRDKTIPQKFFFCWANHSWYKKEKKQSKLLIEQEYGDRTDWEKHFSYLLPFFKDNRYEKKDNKPVFMIYNYNFNEKVPMVQYFDSRCKESGFQGIYIIETFPFDPNDTAKVAEFSKMVSNQTYQVNLREPAVSCAQYWNGTKGSIKQIENKIKRELSYCGVNSMVPVIDGNILYNHMISRNNSRFAGLKVAPGAFFEWDNTPRHSGRGYIINPPTQELFSKYMDQIKNSDYLILNAWNEWAEGMILEPTVENGYKYLEWIKMWSDKNEKYK